MFRQIMMALTLCAALVAAPAYATQSVYTPPSLAALQAAAERGDALSQNHLAVMYAEGRGVEQNYQHASLWFRRAAEQGDAFGQYSLATMYSQGLGLPRDHAQAAKWYSKAARQGDAKAQFLLGKAYYHGTGVAKSQTRAVDWFLAASKGGEREADKYLHLIQYKNQVAMKQLEDGAKPVPFAQQTVGETASHSLGIVYLQGLGAAVSLEAILLWVVLPILCMLGLFAI
ncbi:MAG: tetratricopeptide repeat protein [bacterium]|nr:tetratricopeptide repeat protein [bacterium]